MGLFKKRENSKKFRLEMAEKYNDSVLKYVSERIEGIEKVIAKRGYITLRDGIITISGENCFLFRADAIDVVVNPLLSGDGVIVSGLDELTGKERSIICYFLYYRKV